jgi:hypothetical protein
LRRAVIRDRWGDCLADGGFVSALFIDFPLPARPEN